MCHIVCVRVQEEVDHKNFPCHCLGCDATLRAPMEYTDIPPGVDVPERIIWALCPGFMKGRTAADTGRGLDV